MSVYLRARAGWLAGGLLGAGALVAAAGFLIPLVHGHTGGGGLSFGQAGRLCNSPAGALFSGLSARVGADCAAVNAVLSAAAFLRVAGILAVLTGGTVAGILLMTHAPGRAVALPEPLPWPGHTPADHEHYDGAA